MKHMSTDKAKKIKKLLLVATLSTGISSSVAAWCPPYLVGMVWPGFTAASAALIAEVTAVDASLSAILAFQSERLTSAIAVMTKQKAVSANQVSSMQQNVTQVTAEAINTLEQTERVKQARFDYGSEFGQGVEPCKTLSEREQAYKKTQEAKQQALSAMQTEVDAGAGNYKDPNEVLTKRIENYQTNYCLPGQAFCDENAANTNTGANTEKQALKNVNIAYLFQPTPANKTGADNTQGKTNPAHQAKIDLINQLVGLPTPAVNTKDTGSLATRNYQLLKNQHDAMVSPAIYSLKSIQADNTMFNGEMSKTQLYEHMSKRYMGTGNDGMAWHKTLAVQNDRGLLMEMLKVKSLDLAIQYQEYQQQARMELLLANLLSSEAQKLR